MLSHCKIKIVIIATLKTKNTFFSPFFPTKLIYTMAVDCWMFDFGPHLKAKVIKTIPHH